MCRGSVAKGRRERTGTRTPTEATRELTQGTRREHRGGSENYPQRGTRGKGRQWRWASEAVAVFAAFRVCCVGGGPPNAEFKAVCGGRNLTFRLMDGNFGRNGNMR